MKILISDIVMKRRSDPIYIGGWVNKYLVSTGILEPVYIKIFEIAIKIRLNLENSLENEK